MIFAVMPQGVTAAAIQAASRLCEIFLPDTRNRAVEHYRF